LSQRAAIDEAVPVALETPSELAKCGVVSEADYEAKKKMLLGL
jgi:hypothetical protein